MTAHIIAQAKAIVGKIAIGLVATALCLPLQAAGQEGPTFPKAATFNHDVAPILYKHCVVCHRPNDIAPMSLMTYRDAQP